MIVGQYRVSDVENWPPRKNIRYPRVDDPRFKLFCDNLNKKKEEAKNDGM